MDVAPRRLRATPAALAALVALAAGACKAGGDATPGTAPSGAAAGPSAEPAADAAARDDDAGAAGSEEDNAAADALTMHGTPVVDLSGEAHPYPAARADAPRLAAVSMATDVRKRPDPKAARVGVLRAGAVVELAGSAAAGTAGCKDGWRKVAPFGYVCVGPEATLDLEHPVVRASTRRPDVTQKLPYMYGIATRGGPAYARLPSEQDLAKHEPNLAKHLAKWQRDKESGATYGQELWLKWKPDALPLAADALAAAEAKTTDPDLPWFLKDGGSVPNLSGLVKSSAAVKIDDVARRNGVAFVDSFFWQGRRYALSTDLRVLPSDRFRAIRGSDFHGVRIGVDVDFPFALVRRKGAKKWSYDDKKDELREAGELEWRSAVPLTGKQKFFKSQLHFETKEGFWVDDQHAGRIDPAKKMPGWGKNGEKWIDVNITKQVLVAYEGDKAVYATLVSTGEAGLGDPDKTRATKRGIFRIHTKHISVTMDSDVVGEEFELRDVPYVQYFEEGYALHGAYWHDAFGQPKSHGCINLAPEDARRLFWWTEPQVPAGWHGVARSLTGTVVFVHP